MSTNLSALYRTSLHASTAATATEKDEAFRLRYQVYCVERGFESCEQFASRAETDHYDSRAIHILSRHRASGNVLGVTRLVPDNSKKLGTLPMESHNIPGVNSYLARLRNSGMIRMAEVSRLAVTRDLAGRCVPGDEEQAVSSIRPEIRSHHVSMGLLAVLFRKSLDEGITHWVALADSNLLRCYGRLGIQCHKIGPEVDFRGPRQPMIANMVEVWHEIQRRCPPLAGLIRDLPATHPASRDTLKAPRAAGQQMLFDTLFGNERASSAACA